MAILGKILLVDDDPLVLEALHQTFLDDYQVHLASSGVMAIELIHQHPNVECVVLDIRMTGMDGLQTAARIREINVDLPIIFHTGYPGDYSETDIDSAHQPFDQIVKNEDPARLLRMVKNGVNYYRLKRGTDNIVAIARDEFKMIGKSAAMMEVYQQIEQVAPTDNKVLILGPTGTGKELVARAIHRRSNRSHRRLVPFNCNHKSPDLVESELFGHKRGAFTTAYDDRTGLFEYADGGTVFLDEIGDLDITTQAKILRVIEYGEMYRIGEPEIVKVDVRLICATHRNIAGMVEEGKFREDLYYRIRGFRIILPPLNERRTDIPDLVTNFLDNYSIERGCGIKVFEPAAMDLLMAFDWPGNVRQLQDAVQGIADMTPSSFISRDEVSRYLEYYAGRQTAEMTLQERTKEFKRLVIRQSLAKNDGTISAAAKELGMDSSNLSKLIKDLGINEGI